MSEPTMYAACPVCGRLKRLKKDGTMGHHGGPLRPEWPYGRAYRCDGVGQEPHPDSPTVPL